MWAGFTALVKVQKENPNHDPSNGEFTSAGGGNKVTTFTHTNGHSYTTTHAADGTPIKIKGHYTDKNGVTTTHTIWKKGGAAPSKNTASILKAGLAASGKSQSTPATVGGVYKDDAGNILPVSMPISQVPEDVTKSFAYGEDRQAAFTDYGNAQQAERPATQKQAVVAYQKNSSELNRCLRSADPQDTADQKTLEGLDAAMKTSIVPVDTEVVRGIDVDSQTLTGAGSKNLVGMIFMDKGFMSTTTRQATAKFFGTMTRLSFTIPKGAQGIVMPKFNWEREILLPRGAVLQVEKATVSDGKTTLHCKYLGTGS